MPLTAARAARAEPRNWRSRLGRAYDSQPSTGSPARAPRGSNPESHHARGWVSRAATGGERDAVAKEHRPEWVPPPPVLPLAAAPRYRLSRNAHHVTRQEWRAGGRGVGVWKGCSGGRRAP